MTRPPFTFTELADHVRYALGRPATSAELAALAGTTRRAVERWKHDDRVPPRHVDRLADALHEHPALIWPAYHSTITARGTLSERCAA